MPSSRTNAHNAERARLRPDVDAGRAYCRERRCLKRSRWIRPGTPWDLAHDRRTGEWLGPAHRQCNRSEGATYGNRLRGQRRHRRRAPGQRVGQWQSNAW